MEQKRQKNNTVIIFTEKAGVALLDIEKKYKLEETDEEAIKIIKEGGIFKINILTELIRDYFNGIVSEKYFMDSAQKRLKISSENTKNIFQDISKNIVPFLLKKTEEELKNSTVEENKQIDNSKTQNLETTTPDQEIDRTELNISSKKIGDVPQSRIKKNIPPKKIKPIIKSKKESSGSDKYREPFE